MQYERVDSVHGLDLLVSIAVGRSLDGFAVGRLRHVEALLAENDSAGSFVVEKLWTPKVLREHLEILERDSRRVCIGCRRFVIPEARLEKVLGIRMKGEVPIEVAGFFRLAREVIN